MAKKNRKKFESRDPIDDWLNTLKLKDLKRAAILRGINFRMIGELGVMGLQSWVYKHYEDPINPFNLKRFDDWLDKTLIEEGAIDSPIHVDLKMGFYVTDENGNVKRQGRNSLVFGVKKSNAEVAMFIPKKGSKKVLAFSLIDQGKSTKEIIKQVKEAYPDTSIGSIKVWCSQARKRAKARKELDI